jgi:hypothetical protein
MNLVPEVVRRIGIGVELGPARAVIGGFQQRAPLHQREIRRQIGRVKNDILDVRVVRRRNKRSFVGAGHSREAGDFRPGFPDIIAPVQTGRRRPGEQGDVIAVRSRGERVDMRPVDAVPGPAPLIAGSVVADLQAAIGVTAGERSARTGFEQQRTDVLAFKPAPGSDPRLAAQRPVEGHNPVDCADTSIRVTGAVP